MRQVSFPDDRCIRGVNFRALLLLIAQVGAAASTSIAQTGATPDASQPTNKTSTLRHPMAFGVVSIKRSNPDEMRRIVRSPGGNEFSVINFPFGTVILMAYVPWVLQRKERIVGAPEWVWKESYDFVGKVTTDDSAAGVNLLQHDFLLTENPVLETMLQSALAERCKMVVHRVPAEMPGYELVVGNHGPNWKQLRQTKQGESIPSEALKIEEDGRMIPFERGSENPALHFYQTSAKALARQLSHLGVPVVDKTGLTGAYDFELAKLNNEGDPAVDWDLRALGLRLVPTKIETENIVIDHIERPSPN